MGFRRRLVTWSIGGLVRHLVLVGLAIVSAAIFVTVVVAGTASIAARIALQIVDTSADRRWSEVLAPLSTVPDRYPPSVTNDTALRLERSAVSLGAWLDASGESRLPAATTALTVPDALDEVAALLVAGEAPVWAIDIADCEGAPATSRQGHLQLQRLLLAAGERALASGRPADSARWLEASWQLNSALLRSPNPETFESACSVIAHEMALLRALPTPADHWRVRLAALDLERSALEVYRFTAWGAACTAGRRLADLHPLIAIVGGPPARLLAHQQQDAMLFAVSELPSRDVRSFDPDAFVAEQHARVPRANPIAGPLLPDDWTSWPLSIRTSLDVELALRVLELRTAFAAGSIDDGHRPQPRQPSRIPGVDWLYHVTPEQVTIAIDASGWAEMSRTPLTASISRPSVPRPGAGA